MLRRLLILALLALPLSLLATPAQADTSHCYTPHVAGFNTIESCIFLPELT